MSGRPFVFVPLVNRTRMSIPGPLVLTRPKEWIMLTYRVVLLVTTPDPPRLERRDSVRAVLGSLGDLQPCRVRRHVDRCGRREQVHGTERRVANAMHRGPTAADRRVPRHHDIAALVAHGRCGAGGGTDHPGW